MTQGSKQHNDSNVVQKVEPYGDLSTATDLVIGHDPRLQLSKAEAKYPFFFETLTGPPPTSASERRKYELAQAVCKYINWLAGRQVSLEALYVTNLCNEFAPRQQLGHGAHPRRQGQTRSGGNRTGHCQGALARHLADGCADLLSSVPPGVYGRADGCAQAICGGGAPMCVQGSGRHLCLKRRGSIPGCVRAEIPSSRHSGDSHFARQAVAAQIQYCQIQRANGAGEAGGSSTFEPSSGRWWWIRSGESRTLQRRVITADR